MKVFVPIKRVVDPYVKIRVRKDEKGVETDHVKMVINPFDEIALEEAIRWKEAGLITEITVIAIGSQAVQETLRNGLALGADNAIHIQTETNLEPLAVAKCVKKLVMQHQPQPQIVIMGKQAIDDDCNQTGQMLAGLLNWPQATFASKITFAADKKTVDVTREVDGGLETLTVELPLVITTDLRLNEPRYPTLPNIMKAKSKPLTVIALNDLNVDITSSIDILEVKPPTPRAQGKIVKDTAELLHYLKNVEKVLT